MKFTGRFTGFNFSRRADKNGAGIEPGFHLHQADTRRFVAAEDSLLNRCGAAPAWQQRRVHIQAACLWDIQDRLRQNQPICRDNDHVGFQSCDIGHDLRIFQGLGLPYRDVFTDGEFLHRAGRHLLAAAGRTIRLGQNGFRDVPGFDQRHQRGQCKVRGAGKQEFRSAHFLVTGDGR